MWEFLSRVLEQHGLLAVIVLATYAGLGFACRELWLRGNAAHDGLAKAHKEHGDALAVAQGHAQGREAALLLHENNKRAAMRTEHERELQILRDQIVEAHKQHAARLEHHVDRLDQLHEKRNEELREVLSASLEHIGATRASVEKITDAMQTLKDVVRR